MSLPGCTVCHGNAFVHPEPGKDDAWYGERGLWKLEAADLPSRTIAKTGYVCYCHQSIVQMALHAGRPLYWQDEQTGTLAGAVARYLKEEPLEPQDLRLLKGYVLQWAATIQARGRVSIPDYAGSEGGSQGWMTWLAGPGRESLHRATDELLNLGIDPW